VSEDFTTCPICYSVTTYTYMTDHIAWHTERGEIEYPEKTEPILFGQDDYNDLF